MLCVFLLDLFHIRLMTFFNLQTGHLCMIRGVA